MQQIIFPAKFLFLLRFFKFFSLFRYLWIYQSNTKKNTEVNIIFDYSVEKHFVNFSSDSQFYQQNYDTVVPLLMGSIIYESQNKEYLTESL